LQDAPTPLSGSEEKPTGFGIERSGLRRKCRPDGSGGGTLECELIERETFATKTEARLSVFEFVEGWYNPERLHSGIGYRSPQRYEEEYHSQGYSRSEEPQSPVAA